MATASVHNTFANAVTATGLQLDQNFSTIVAYINEPLNRSNFATDSGNTNTVVLTFSPPVSAYSAGLEITFKVANTNTGATVINANALGNKSFVQPGGSDLAAGQIEANGIYKAAFNGSQFVYIGQNVLAASQGDMETATSAVTFVSPSTTKYHPGVAKAWAVWNGTITGTITASATHNISSIVRNGTGSYALTLASPLASSHYAFSGGAWSSNRGIGLDQAVESNSATVHVVVFAADDASQQDVTKISFILFGDLP